MDKIKQIGFKAGEKPRRPVIQADTSASKSYASIAYGISEGEIVGLVDGAKSIILDGTPVMSSSGDLNIPDVTIQERKGTNDQTHLEGFPAVVNEKQYNNIEMLFSTPFVHYINDTNLDAVGIRFTFGALQRTDPDDGDVSGITIEYAIDVQVDGQGYQELLRTNIVGKYSAGYQRYHRVELPPAEEGWEVRIRRLSPNTTSTYIADKMYLDAVAEILDVKMRYPNTALIGLKFDSERFSNIPKVDFRMRGKIIRVPANYDPVNRTYAQSGEGTTNGIWNGQFKMAYTTNPAWIFYDLVLNKRYGLGNRIDPSMLDKWSLYSIAQYCDVMVPDGEGGLEPRFTCNVYINNRFEAYDCLMQLAGVFRGIMYWSGTAIIAGCDRPQDPVFTYTRANIIGEFNYSGTRTRDRHSVVMVSFDDPKNNYKTDKEVVSDRKAISEIGVRTKDLAAFACTSRGQAQRAGKWALFKEQLETRIVTFALGMDGYIAPVGRVIEIADPLLAGRAVGGRIAAVSSDKKTITLDRDTEVKVGDRLVLNNEEGEQESRQVASVTGRNITVSVAFDSPAVEHVWAVDSDDLQLMRFTVISVTENRSQDSINFTVTALQHEPALHEVADYSAYIERNNYSVIDITTQKAPAEVLISSNNRINQGIDITDLVISWKQAENAVKYHVQWRRDDGNWIQMPFQYGNQVTIENIYHGVYEAKVVAINAAEVNSLPASSLPTPINSKFAEPATLASLTATGILFGIELNWKFPLYGAQNAAYVEIYWAINADKGDEKLLGSYAYPTTETTLNGLSPHQTIHFRARLVDRNGIASGFTAWVTATVVADPDKLLDILNGHIGLAAIDAELAQAIDDNTTGVAEAKALANQALVDANNSASDASAAADAVAQEAIDRAAAMTAQSDALMADSAAKVQALKDEVDPKITSLQDGITQVTTDYEAADAQVVGQLNAYKTSNDSAVASVLQKAESAVATGSTNSSAITAINGQISTLEGSISTKADASALTALTTRVTNAEGVNTSQGNAITSLENTINHATTGLASKASSAALTVVDNKVTAANGRIDTTNSNLTTLTGRVDTVEGVVSTKADATALTNLTTRVTNAEGVNTSQGTAITDLQNTVNHATTGLSTKASTSALNLTNSEVTRIDGAVSGHTNQLTQLTSDINTINGTLATKANASALNDIYTKSQTDAKATEIAAGQITAFEATLALGGGWMDIGREGAQLAVERGAGTIEVLDRTLNHFKTTATSDGGFSVYIGACNNSSAIPVGTPYVMTGKVRASRANLYDRIYSRFNQYTSESYVYGWNASSDWVSFKASGVTNTQDQHPLHNIIGAYVPWAIAGDWVEFKDCRIAINSDSVTSANANAIQNTNAEVSRVDGRVTTESNRITTLAGRVSTVEGSKADASALNSLTSRVEAEEGKSTSQGTAITNLENTINSPTTGLATKASAQALTTLNNQVQHSTTGLSAVNTKVDTLKATVESTTSGLPSKASSAALDTLSNKVNHSTTGLDAIANKTTALESNVDSALKAVTISDTRSDNQPPSWYWTNYRHRRVTEFKFNTAIGVSSFFGGTYCYLETVVPWSDSSGGHLIQTATSANDPSLYVQRTSTSTSAWSAWAQPIKDLRDGLTAKASASALNSLTTRVTTAEGTISSEATKLSNLTTTVGGHTTSIATQTSTIDGIQAKHTVKINNNGFVTGYGLISTANNGAVVSAFKVDADAFAVGKSGSGILPFVVTTAGQTINGIRYPEAGTWINSAYIASATIGTAHINDLAVTTAKIGDGQITTAKIGDAQITSAKIGNAEVKTLKIDGEAVTAVSSVVYATYVCAKTYTINNQLTAAILAMKPDYPSTVKGLLIGTPFANITVNPEGGGVQVDISTNAMWESRVDGGAGGTFIYYIAVFLSGQLKVAQIDFIGNTSIPGQDNPAQARANSFVRFIFKGIPNGAKVEAYYAVAFAQTPNLYVMKARDLTVTVTSVKR